MGTEGPDHDRAFLVAVEVDGQVIGTGRGRSKKLAEQAAARAALLSCAAPEPAADRIRWTGSRRGPARCARGQGGPAVRRGVLRANRERPRTQSMIRHLMLAFTFALCSLFVALPAWAGSYLDRASLLLDEARREGDMLLPRTHDKELVMVVHALAEARARVASKMECPAAVAKAHPHLLLVLENSERAADAAAQGNFKKFMEHLHRGAERGPRIPRAPRRARLRAARFELEALRQRTRREPAPASKRVCAGAALVERWAPAQRASEHRRRDRSPRVHCFPSPANLFSPSISCRPRPGSRPRGSRRR